MSLASQPPGTAFAEHRDHVFGVAYRMLGSVAEAEDVVQEAYLRWSALDPASVRSPVAFLTTVATRLAIDRLRSARARREVYVGPWLPEPLVSDLAGPGEDPAGAAELAESLTTAFLVLLERLNPLERAVLLLHDVFGYPYDDIAEVVGRPAGSCRQAASRARAKVGKEQHERSVVTGEEELQLVAAFGAAAGSGDLAALEAVLADDVVLWSDGGPDRHAARRPVLGPRRVARFVASVTRRIPPDAEFAFASVNGEPGLVARTPDGPHFTLAVTAGASGVRAIHVVINPDKLRHLA